MFCSANLQDRAVFAMCVELRFIRPENLVSPLGEKQEVPLIPSVFSCVFTEERIEFGHTVIKPRLGECCSDVWFLPSTYMIMELN